MLYFILCFQTPRSSIHCCDGSLLTRWEGFVLFSSKHRLRRSTSYQFRPRFTFSSRNLCYSSSGRNSKFPSAISKANSSTQGVLGSSTLLTVSQLSNRQVNRMRKQPLSFFRAYAHCMSQEPAVYIDQYQLRDLLTLGTASSIVILFLDFSTMYPDYRQTGILNVQFVRSKSSLKSSASNRCLPTAGRLLTDSFYHSLDTFLQIGL